MADKNKLISRNVCNDIHILIRTLLEFKVPSRLRLERNNEFLTCPNPSQCDISLSNVHIPFGELIFVRHCIRCNKEPFKTFERLLAVTNGSRSFGEMSLPGAVEDKARDRMIYIGEMVALVNSNIYHWKKETEYYFHNTVDQYVARLLNLPKCSHARRPIFRCISEKGHFFKS